MRVRPAERFELGWLQQRANCILTPQAHGLACVDASGRLRAMVAYDDFTPNSCAVHMACETPIAWRRMVPDVFRYPFETLGLGVATGTVVASNASSLALTKHLGFREVHRVKDGWAVGEDLVVHELRREDCAWLQRKAA